MKQILFVDDEIKVLEGLGRMLRTMRHDWDMTFLADPREAVKLIPTRSSMRSSSTCACPRWTVPRCFRRRASADPAWRESCCRVMPSARPRCALSGSRTSSSQSRAMRTRCAGRSRGPASCAICCMTAACASSVCQLGKLPSLPRLYHAITEEMNHEEVSLKRVAAIISQDIAMTAKVLQLVNSAFFGLGRRVSSIEQAVSYLGVDVIRSLVVSQVRVRRVRARRSRLLPQLFGSTAGPPGRSPSGSRSSSRGTRSCTARRCRPACCTTSARSCSRRACRRSIASVREPRVAGEGALLPREQELFGCDHGAGRRVSARASGACRTGSSRRSPITTPARMRVRAVFTADGRARGERARARACRASAKPRRRWTWIT